MSKRILCIVAGCAIVLACVGIAYGAAVKIRGFENIAEPNPDADGMAILNYSLGQNKTTVQVILSDFTPFATYVVLIDTNAVVDVEEGTVVIDAFHEFSAAVQTNGKGHITLHGEVFGADVSGYHVLVLPSPIQVGDNELRAIGLNPGQ